MHNLIIHPERKKDFKTHLLQLQNGKIPNPDPRHFTGYAGFIIEQRSIYPFRPTIYIYLVFKLNIVFFLEIGPSGSGSDRMIFIKLGFFSRNSGIIKYQ